ncbi:MAG: hypothetical protein ACXWJZ_08145 [Burkholderiaceae bacterium]
MELSDIKIIDVTTAKTLPLLEEKVQDYVTSLRNCTRLDNQHGKPCSIVLRGSYQNPQVVVKWTNYEYVFLGLHWQYPEKFSQVAALFVLFDLLQISEYDQRKLDEGQHFHFSL